MEPVYQNSDYAQYSFHKYTTLKIINVAQENHKDYASKAIFYLNVHYLKPTGQYAYLEHLIPADNDGVDHISAFEAIEIDKVVGRKRIIKRDDFEAVEPLILYNHACGLRGDDQFHGFYRVIEYFFTRYQEKRLAELRYDTDVQTANLLDEVLLRQEIQFLQRMLLWGITSALREKLCNFAFYHGLVEDSSFDKLVRGLYQFRNSVVHAKEKELELTFIPDPFEQNRQLPKWIYIAKTFAERLIKKLNVKESSI